MIRPKASSAQASARMMRIRQSATDIEQLVRQVASSVGLRYRLRNRDLPGSPDLANRHQKWAVFVHGCFWHWHPDCTLATIPKSNPEFWKLKLTANRERDARKEKLLLRQGYRVCIIWGCETRREKYVARKLRRLLPR
jgi:DNA mismatch endonuclease Vsr